MAGSKRRSRYGSKRRSKKKFGSKRRAPTNRSLSKRIKKIESSIELKYADQYIPTLTIDDTSSAIIFPIIPQGLDAQSERIGNQISATSLQLRMSFIAAQAEVVPTNIRCILVWDKNPDSTSLPMIAASGTTASVLDGSIVTSALYAPFKYSYKKRVKVLWDYRFVLNPMVVASTTADVTDAVVPVQQDITKIFKFNREIKYDGPTASVADISQNSLNLYLVSDKSFASEGGPVFELGSRLYYKDA